MRTMLIGNSYVITCDDKLWQLIVTVCNCSTRNNELNREINRYIGNIREYSLSDDLVLRTEQ